MNNLASAEADHTGICHILTRVSLGRVIAPCRPMHVAAMVDGPQRTLIASWFGAIATFGSTAIGGATTSIV